MEKIDNINNVDNYKEDLKKDDNEDYDMKLEDQKIKNDMLRRQMKRDIKKKRKDLQKQKNDTDDGFGLILYKPKEVVEKIQSAKQI